MASQYAIEGSGAHALAAACLRGGKDAAAFVGRCFTVEQEEHAYLSASGGHRWINCPGSLALEKALVDDEADAEVHEVEVTEDMAEAVQVYLDHVRRVVGDRGTLLVEQRVVFGDAIGAPGMYGTADAVVLHDDRLTLIDLKFGRGVKVDAAHNEQLQLYALGAIADYGMLQDFTSVDLHIVQPRIDHIDTWTTNVEELNEFAERARVAASDALVHVECTKGVGDQRADRVHAVGGLVPGEKQCRFCRAKATCPALRAEVTTTVFDAAPASPDEFANITGYSHDFETSNAQWLAAVMAKVDLVEDWCKAVRAEVERRLFAGEAVPGFKLVEGRRGPRKWADESAALELLKSFRLKKDEMYDFTLISPTKAEKLFSDSPKRWNKVKALVTQTEGKPSVARESDKRPALSVKPVADEFDVLV